MAQLVQMVVLVVVVVIALDFLLLEMEYRAKEIMVVLALMAVEIVTHQAVVVVLAQ
jgi:hypothetical protein